MLVKIRAIRGYQFFSVHPWQLFLPRMHGVSLDDDRA